MHEIVIKEKTTEELAKERDKEVKSKQEKVKRSGKEFKQKEMLDLSRSLVVKEAPNDEKMRKRIIKGIKRTIERQKHSLA